MIVARPLLPGEVIRTAGASALADLTGAVDVQDIRIPAGAKALIGLHLSENFRLGNLSVPGHPTISDLAWRADQPEMPLYLSLPPKGGTVRITCTIVPAAAATVDCVCFFLMEF